MICPRRLLRVLAGGFSLALAIPAGSQDAPLARIQMPSRDQVPPRMPNGQPVQAAIAATGDALCWADPSTDGRVVTGEFGELRGHKSSPHAGVDFRAFMGNAVYAVADGCVSFGNPTPRQLIGLKMRINDKFPNSSVWYLHLSRIVPKFINDGRAGQCIPVRKGELVGYSGNFYGTGGAEVSSGAAHLHLSYFVSGLQINPAPYRNPPPEIPLEYNTIRDIASNAVSGASTGDGSGTRGSRLGFAVPRMCNTFVVKNSGQETIRFDGRFGTGNFTANPIAPSQAALESAQESVRRSLGATPENMAKEQIEDVAHWTGGMPEEPDWDSYKDMSFEQVIQAEVSRRMSDQRWAEELSKMSARGLEVERMRIKALAARLLVEIVASRQRQEALLATLQTTKARNLRATANPQPGRPVR